MGLLRFSSIRFSRSVWVGALTAIIVLFGMQGLAVAQAQDRVRQVERVAVRVVSALRGERASRVALSPSSLVISGDAGSGLAGRAGG